jgi:hypothetical protein
VHRPSTDSAKLPRQQGSKPRRIIHTFSGCLKERTLRIQHPLDSTADAGCLAQDNELEPIAGDQSHVFAELSAISRHAARRTYGSEALNLNLNIWTRETRREISASVQRVQTRGLAM